MEPAALQILFAGRLRRHLGTFDRHYSDHWAIHLVIDARVAWGDGDGPRVLTGDWLWTGHPGQRIAFAPQGRPPALHWRFALRGTLLRDWLDEGLWPTGPLPVREPLPAQAAADRVLDALDGDEALDTRRRANAVEALLLEIRRQQGADQTLPSWVLEVQAALSAAWQRKPDYAAMARRFLMPEPAMRRDFRRHVGTSLHQWFARERHRQVRQALLSDDADLATVAGRCGYADPAWFSREFKRLSGISPGAFRQTRFG